jgi:pimeloyl-ACP methyl ester carboxylesterase
MLTVSGAGRPRSWRMRRYSAGMGHFGPGYDWGERADRWAGVVSQVVEIGGIQVHYLSANSPGAAVAGRTHLLVHPMGTGSWSWMDVIGPLSAGGRVFAPDLPGAGRTRPADKRAARAEHGPRFLHAFLEALDLEQVVLHGHSLGGLVSALFAARHPERVSHLVLTSPVLPGRPDPPRFPRAWRAALAVAPVLAPVPMRIGMHIKARAWRRWQANPTNLSLAKSVFRSGADVTGISPQFLTLVAEEVDRLQLPWRVDGALQAAVSAGTALTVDEDRVRGELDRVQAPTLVLWGERDRALPRALVEDLRLARPTWTFRDVPGVGHLLPWEAPTMYLELVQDWTDTES